MNDHPKCFFVERDEQGRVRRGMRPLAIERLPPGDALIRVQFSSLNYKDALAAEAHPGVVRNLPHVPGIDAAGVVESDASGRFQPGDEVIVTSYGLGADQWGGWADYIRVPSDWVVPRPDGLSLHESMMLGTAGFTAAQCVQALLTNGLKPDHGEILVTGATGGVGCLAVMILAQLGFAVAAVTGKLQLQSQLKQWGASRVIGRQEVVSDSPRPLLTGKWAGAIDTVGGQMLATILRETKNYGVIAACGLVGGTDLPLTVHPFILRGVILAGINSQSLPADRRQEIWNKLAGPWKPRHLVNVATTIGLDGLEDAVQRILKGEIVGRTVVAL